MLSILNYFKTILPFVIATFVTLVIRYLANDSDDEIDDDDNDIEQKIQRSLNTEQKMHEMIGYDDHSVTSPNGSVSSA